MRHDTSRLFAEIQRFRGEELPSFYEQLARALDSGTDEYEAELEAYTAWAVKRICELIFPDFLGTPHRPDEFFLAFSIGSSLLEAEARHIRFSDKVIEPDLSSVFCPYCAAGLDHQCSDADGRKPITDLLVAQAQQFLTEQLPDAWFGLIAKMLPRCVNFCVDAPIIDCARDKTTRRELFSVLWKTKALIRDGKAEDLLLLDDGGQFRPCRSVAGHIKCVLISNGDFLGHETDLLPAGSFVSAAYQAFVQTPICALAVNREALRRCGYALSRFLDICLNWLLLGMDFSMAICYGGSDSPQLRRCNSMLFLYTKKNLKPIRQFALAEMAHLVLDNLVSLEDEHYAQKQGWAKGVDEGMERLRSALAYLSHDYASAKGMLLSIPDVGQARRVFDTLFWLLKAARKYAMKGQYKASISWSDGGYGGETVAETLERAYDHYSDSCVSITVKGDVLVKKEVDVRLVGALTELVRNIAKYTLKDGYGNVTIEAGPQEGTIVIRAESEPVYNGSWASIADILAGEAAKKLEGRWRGVLTISRFLSDLLWQPKTSPAPERWWTESSSSKGTYKKSKMIFHSPPIWCGERYKEDSQNE